MLRIFNEKRVDELMILDIGVSSEKYKIDFIYSKILLMSQECRFVMEEE